MPDDRYRTDIIPWSRQQAERLRRHVAGERVNDLALELARWPERRPGMHWSGEAAGLLDQAQDRDRPSMVQQIEVERCFARARKAVLAIVAETPGRPIAGRTDLTLAPLTDEAANLRALTGTLGRAPA